MTARNESSQLSERSEQTLPGGSSQHVTLPGGLHLYTATCTDGKTRSQATGPTLQGIAVQRVCYMVAEYEVVLGGPIVEWDHVMLDPIHALDESANVDTSSLLCLTSS